MRDYYDILGVPPDASPDEIKRAYKTLARRHHPDTNSGSRAAEEAFKELSGAYGVLSDPGARILYDLYGSTGTGDGGRTGTAPWRAPAPAATELATPPLYLTPAEMAAGCTRLLPLPCPACGGQPRETGERCSACAGRGWSPASPSVRLDVPAGVSIGDILWGEILADGKVDPVPFMVRLRRAARAPTGPASEADAGAPSRQTRRTTGRVPPRRRVDIFPGHSPAPSRSAHATARTRIAAALAAARARLATGAGGLERRVGRVWHGLGEDTAYPLAVQLAATARALDHVGDRQVEELKAIERRLATDLTRLRQLLPRDAAPIPVLAALDDSGRIIFAPRGARPRDPEPAGTGARSRARLGPEAPPADRERELARIHGLALEIHAQLSAMSAGAHGLAEGVRRDFEQAVGIPARESVAAGVRNAVAALLRSDAGAPTLPAPSRAGPRLVYVALDLLAFALWAVSVTAAAVSLALRSLPFLRPATLAWAAGLAPPLAASLAALVAKRGLVSAGRATLTQRAVPWPEKRAPILALSLALVLALLAASVGVRLITIPSPTTFTAVWDGGTVLVAALAGFQLDAAVFAVCRSALLLALAVAWIGLRIADATFAALQKALPVGSRPAAT